MYWSELKDELEKTATSLEPSVLRDLLKVFPLSGWTSQNRFDKVKTSMVAERHYREIIENKLQDEDKEDDGSDEE